MRSVDIACAITIIVLSIVMVIPAILLICELASNKEDSFVYQMFTDDHNKNHS